jgi:hypothetical protein
VTPTLHDGAVLLQDRARREWSAFSPSRPRASERRGSRSAVSSLWG